MAIKHYTSAELEKHIQEEYARLRPMAESEGYYLHLGVEFTSGTPCSMEATYCYAEEDGYHYRYVERGVDVQHDIVKSVFEISYLVIKPLVFRMACDYERKHRIGTQDSRRAIFHKELQLLSVIGENYKKSAEAEIYEILRKHPFHDKL